MNEVRPITGRLSTSSMVVTGSRLSHRPPRLAGPAGLGVGFGVAEVGFELLLDRLGEVGLAALRLGALEHPVSAMAASTATAISGRWSSLANLATS